MKIVEIVSAQTYRWHSRHFINVFFVNIIRSSNLKLLSTFFGSIVLIQFCALVVHLGLKFDSSFSIFEIIYFSVIGCRGHQNIHTSLPFFTPLVIYFYTFFCCWMVTLRWFEIARTLDISIIFQCAILLIQIDCINAANLTI